MKQICMRVEGMTCGGCVRNVSEVLQNLDGVEHVSVSLEEGMARVDCDPDRVSVARLREAVEQAGFDVPA